MQNDSLLNAAKSILTASPESLDESLGSPWGNPFKGNGNDIIWLSDLPSQIKKLVSNVNSGRTYQTVHIAMKPAAKSTQYLLFDKAGPATNPALILVK